MDKHVEWLKKYGIVVSALSLLFSAVLSPFGLDALVGAYAFLGAALVFALGALMVWTARKVLLKWILLLLIVACAGGLAYLLWWAWQPHFEITAFDTLDEDRNAYELTDQLIWNQSKPEEYGVSITFTLEIRPIYYGKQAFGSMVAFVSGDSHNPPIQKPLWNNFTSASGATQIHLTLSELLYVSGLRKNSDPPNNPFGPGDLPFQQARVIVRVARKAYPAHPWTSEEIIVRNAPWEQRSALVQRDGRREVDIYVKNLGGTGGFTVRYRLVRLGRDIGTSSLPEVSGATTVTSWNEPRELVYLGKGEFFTDTVSVPDQLAQGRYLLEAYAVKKQNYVQFQDPRTRFENLNSMNSPWWFGGYPPDEHLFVVTTPEFEIDPTVQTEWNRLQGGGIFDLGLVTGPAEDVTSASGAVGLRQVFQNGEIYVHDGQTYALYGPILEHYKELGGIEYHELGFPVSAIQAVTSSSGEEGVMAEFEGRGSPHLPTAIYASRQGAAAIWQWNRRVYSAEQGGHSGWLGFPLTDKQSYAGSSAQMFEYGYIISYNAYVGGEPDWSRPPIAYRYLASCGTIFDVYAQQSWQDTGVQVQPGDRVTVVQVAGSWTNGYAGQWFDTNGIGMEFSDYAVLPKSQVGALIGKIGEGGMPFLVGRWGAFVVSEMGSLYLAMNDGNYEDNEGLITVQIVVED